MSSGGLPSFERPPVIETVLGVQFDPLQEFRNAHLGAFWKFLGPAEWPKVTDAPTIDPQFERFGEAAAWQPRGVHLKISQDPSARLMMHNAAGDRMIQLQNGRLHYNWLGQIGGPYPRYTTIRPEFCRVLGRLREFLAGEGVGEPVPNQWEVTYVNHIPRGGLWNMPSDWTGVFVSLPGVAGRIESLRLESFGGEGHFEIEPQRGRLHIHLEHGRFGKDQQQEVLRLVLTARGPIPGDGEGDMLGAGLDLGRQVIVTTFKAITTDHAHEYWGLLR